MEVDSLRGGTDTEGHGDPDNIVVSWTDDAIRTNITERSDEDGCRTRASAQARDLLGEYVPLGRTPSPFLREGISNDTASQHELEQREYPFVQRQRHTHAAATLPNGAARHNASSTTRWLATTGGGTTMPGAARQSNVPGAAWTWVGQNG